MVAAILETQIPEYITPYEVLKNPCGVQGIAANGVERRVFDLVADGNRQIRPQLDVLIPEKFGTGWTVSDWWTTGYEF